MMEQSHRYPAHVCTIQLPCDHARLTEVPSWMFNIMMLFDIMCLMIIPINALLQVYSHMAHITGQPDILIARMYTYMCVAQQSGLTCSYHERSKK